MPYSSRLGPHGYNDTSRRVVKRLTNAEAKRQALVNQTRALIDEHVREYAKAHGKNQLWITPVRAYYESLTSGVLMSKNFKLDPESQTLVREWTEEAARETGLELPKMAARPQSKRKKKPRK